MWLYLKLILGFVILIKGADFLVDGASSIAFRLKVPPLTIGLTVVAFGTSLPEFFVSLFASTAGNTDLAIGNILGSNIANILLILGISALIYPLAVTRGTVWKEIPCSLVVILILGITLNDQLINRHAVSMLSRSDGLILLIFFVMFLYYTFISAKNGQESMNESPPKEYSRAVSVIFILLGFAGLSVGGHLIVGSAIKLATRMGVSESFIGLTIVALGTSLPELATSAVAAAKKNSDIAVGNVVGSNIFNIAFVLGLSSTVTPLPFHLLNNLDIAVVILASFMLFLSMFTGKKHVIDRWEGSLFVLFYLGYIAFLIYRR